MSTDVADGAAASFSVSSRLMLLAADCSGTSVYRGHQPFIRRQHIPLEPRYMSTRLHDVLFQLT